MEKNSPLQYLDTDVSKYLYNQYYPNDITREKKRELNEQFLNKINTFLLKYTLDNIYVYFKII